MYNILCIYCVCVCIYILTYIYTYRLTYIYIYQSTYINPEAQNAVSLDHLTNIYIILYAGDIAVTVTLFSPIIGMAAPENPKSSD